MDPDTPSSPETEQAPGILEGLLSIGLWFVLGSIALAMIPVLGWFLFQGWAWLDLREDRQRMGLMQQEAVLVTAPPGAELVDTRVTPAIWDFVFLSDDAKDTGPASRPGSVSHSYAPVTDLAGVAGFYLDLLTVEGWEFRRLVCRHNDEERFSIGAEKRLDNFVIEASIGASLSSGSARVRLTAPFHTQERRARGSGFTLEGDCSSFGIPPDFEPLAPISVGGNRVQGIGQQSSEAAHKSRRPHPINDPETERSQALSSGLRRFQEAAAEPRRSTFPGADGPRAGGRGPFPYAAFGPRGL